MISTSGWMPMMEPLSPAGKPSVGLGRERRRDLNVGGGDPARR
jgi:hypothetical protein